MKTNKNPDPKKQAIEIPNDEMQELEDDLMNQVSGAGNPFDRPRMGYQPIDDDLINNG